MVNNRSIIIATPVYNDWSSFDTFLQEINNVAINNDFLVHIVAIDDGSTQLRNPNFGSKNILENIERIDIIHLARNLGHQKAISLGLAYIEANFTFSQLIIMDCDGEDQPIDIPNLLDVNYKSPNNIIFARRTQRSEGIIFNLFYLLYKLGFRALTGEGISFGNYSLIPADMLKRIIFLPEIWNHFAAGIVHANLPWKVIPTVRGHRYIGYSKMNFVSLVVHGLSAISVFIEVVTVRLMLLSLIVILLGTFGFIAILYVRYFTILAIPGWATSVAIGLVVLMFQALLFLVLLSFVVLNFRTNRLFIPAIDYLDYILDIERVM